MTEYALKSGELLPSVDSDEYMPFIANAHANRERLMCLCTQPPVQMYIAKILDNYYIKRMPDTGSLHSVNCKSYEEPAGLTGRGELDPSSIKTDAESGETKLKIDFSLSKMSGTRAPIEPSNAEQKVVTADPSKLSIRAMYHYLLDESGLSYIDDKKRFWPMMRSGLLSAAESLNTKNIALSERIFIPEPFKLDDKDNIQHRLTRFMNTLKPSGHAKQTSLGILIGEVKAFDEARFGYKIVIKHLPSFPFFIDEKSYEKLYKTFEYELSAFECIENMHLICVATFALSPSGHATIDSITLIASDRHWIPFDSQQELDMNDRLIGKGMPFKKGLRYNLGRDKIIASYVITTSSGPIACFFSDGSEESQAKIEDLAADTQVSYKIWDVHADSAPQIPE